MRFPGGAVLNCWGGGAAWTASSEKADGSPVTKVNLFYNSNQVTRGVQVFWGKLKSMTYPGWLATGAADAGIPLLNSVDVLGYKLGVS